MISLPKVSIIIPVYAVELYIQSCIESIIQQNYKNIEVLIINDKTPDASITIAQNIIKKYKGNIDFRIINHEHNRKVSAARNTGIKESHGDYIFFLDSDDMLLPNAIRALVEEAITTNADVVNANRKAIEWDTKIEHTMIESDYTDYRPADDSILWMDKIQFHGTVWNKLIKKDFIIREKLFFKEGIAYEDDLWIYKLIYAKPHMSFISDCTYVYHIRESSITQAYTEFHLFSRIIVANEAIRHLKLIEPDTCIRSYAYKTINSFVEGALKDCIEKVQSYRDYYKLYKYFRHRIIYRKDYVTNKEISFRSKMLFMHNFFPIPVGALIDWTCIKYKIKLWPYHYVFMNDSNKITINSEFWEKIAKYEVNNDMYVNHNDYGE